jgi:glycosyltransferase involved in cell wall biosynthesis
LNPTKFGSLEEQIFLLAQRFKRHQSLFVPVFARPLRGKDGSAYHEAGLPVVHLDFMQFTISTFLKLMRLIERHKIEVIHWNLYNPMNIYVGLLTIAKPHVMHFMTDHISRTSSGENSSQPAKRWMKRILFRCYNKVGGISNFVLEDLRKQGCWGNLFRQYHFINTERFKPNPYVRAEIRDRQNVADRFVILVVAHLIPEKGVDVVLKALKALPTHVVLWIVGEGTERDSLEAMARQLNLKERVVFWGLQENVEPYMQAADCFVCPSIWGEAVGLVNLEALACGLPVIASAVGGIPELIDEGKTGLLFPAGDQAALTERITRLLTIPMLTHAMGERARSMAVDRFSIEGKLDELLKVYVADSERSHP